MLAKEMLWRVNENHLRLKERRRDRGQRNSPYAATDDVGLLREAARDCSTAL